MSDAKACSVEDSGLQKAAELLRLQSSGEMSLEPRADVNGTEHALPATAPDARPQNTNNEDRPVEPHLPEIKPGTSNQHDTDNRQHRQGRSTSPSNNTSSKEQRVHGSQSYEKHRNHHHHDHHRRSHHRSRSRSPRRHHHHHKHDNHHHRHRGRSRSRDRHHYSSHSHHHHRDRRRSRSRSRSDSRKRHHHHHHKHKSREHEHAKHRHQHDQNKVHTPPKQITEPTLQEAEALLPHSKAAISITPPGGRPLNAVAEALHRSESGHGLVVKLKLKSASPSSPETGDLLGSGAAAELNIAPSPQGGVNDVDLLQQGDVSAAQIMPVNSAQRLSFVDDLDLTSLPAIGTAPVQPASLTAQQQQLPFNSSSPIVLSPRKITHEKTLVSITLTQPGSAPSQTPGLLPLDLLLQDELEPLSMPTSPAAPRNLGPIVFGSARAQGMRPYMEDRHTIIQDYFPLSSSGHVLKDEVPRSFAAVYDGHNGCLAADHAADRLHDILAGETALRTCLGDGPPAALVQEEERMAAALIHSFEATDKEILTRCRVESMRGGATGVVMVRIGDILYAAHIGDSRAIMCRCGEPLILTEDHKPNLPRERKRVEALGGRVDYARCWRVIVDPGNGRPASGLAVSRAFGDPDFKEPLKLITASPDVMSERLLPGDTFVILASDGLWDVLSNKEACDLVTAHIQAAMSSNPPPPLELIANTAAEMLVQSSLKAGTMDNVTALVALLQWT